MPPNDDQGDMEQQPTYSQYWPMTICIIGIILLFLGVGECFSHFSLDGDNNPESNYTTQFCYSGLFFMFIATILSTSIDSKKEKARKEKMTEEEKQLYNKEKKEKDTKLATQLFITFLITLFTIIFLTFGH